MTDCIFCKIAAGKIPCEKIYEDERTLAFLDIKPISKGHVLVIHKEHHDDLFAMHDDCVAEAMRTVRKVASVAMKALKADGINIGMNNKPAAGQVVFHAHFHVIPRYNADGLKMWPHMEKAPDAKETAALIRKFLV